MITISNLHFDYSRKNRLFEELNLELAPGKIHGLLGKNGTGKSTLLNLIAGLLIPKDGEIEVQGRTPSKRQVAFLQNLFLVPEEFYTPDVNSRGLISLYASFYPQFDDEQFWNYLKEFEVDPDHKLNKMSMGQRKKAFIAFALACNTQLLLMDEPTNGLDIPSKAQFRRLIASVANDKRCIVISTHQVRDLENLIDTVVILENHRIIFNQEVDVISDKLSFAAYNESGKPQGVLYEEAGVLGGKAILANHGEPASRIDIELLFNALIRDNGNIFELFTDKKANQL